MTLYGVRDRHIFPVGNRTFETMTEAILWAETAGIEGFTVVPCHSDGKTLTVNCR